MAPRIVPSSPIIATLDHKMCRPHTTTAYRNWAKLEHLSSKKTLEIDGYNLDLASVVAVCKYGCLPTIDKSPAVLDRVRASVSMLRAYLEKGYNVYGSNTGFGGSASTRTRDLAALQRSLMQHTQSGVLINTDKDNLLDHPEWNSHAMPPSWVKGLMLARCNSTVRGHSAVTLEVIEAIMDLLQNDLTPVIPLRGSVTASGDLMPLSYVVGAIQGNPDVFVRTGKDQGYKVISSKEALKLRGAKAIVLGPNEGLGLINGTAAAASVASLALYETQHLAVLSQALTALAVEALAGTRENFEPFISAVRPHQGQIEAAQNIYAFLDGSQLIGRLGREQDKTKTGLFQARYAVRSAPQWLGPVLEDLLLSQTQITTELNSTSANPVVDVDAGAILSGANFQGASVTMAVEKARLGLQMMGKILFAQSTEMISPDLNNGLPANLAADEPSLSYTMKHVDVNIAAYQTELAFLASPVSSHVQSTEMHNQAINSVGLISARYTMEAVRLVSLIAASHLYVCCQAVDLRVMHLGFLREFQPRMRAITDDIAGGVLSPPDVDSLHVQLEKYFTEAWFKVNCLDSHERFDKVVDGCVAVVARALACSDVSIATLGAWRTRLRSVMEETYVSFRTRFFESQNTAEYLGRVSGRLYTFVRRELGVPFHQGLVEHPTADEEEDHLFNGRPKKTIGSWIGVIYEALRSGRLERELMRSVGQELGEIGHGGIPN